MSAYVKTEEIVGQLGHLNDQVLTFKAQRAEADRLAAIKAAQDLIRKLQTPQESNIEISYNVLIKSLGLYSGAHIALTAPLADTFSMCPDRY